MSKHVNDKLKAAKEAFKKADKEVRVAAGRYLRAEKQLTNMKAWKARLV